MPNLKFLASTVCEILGGSPNSKIGLRGPNMTPFDPILHFFRKNSPPYVSLPNLKLLPYTVREILGGSKNFKSGSRDSDMNPFDPTLYYLSLELTAFCLSAKFEVSSFNRLRDIMGVPKVGHVTPT